MITLRALPNIGKGLEKQLIAIGIDSIYTLKELGSREAWTRIRLSHQAACMNRLCALEGAIRGIRWHNLQ